MGYFADPVVKFIVFCSVLISILIPIYNYLVEVKLDGTQIALYIIFMIALSYMIIFGRIFMGPNFFEKILNSIFNISTKKYEDVFIATDVIEKIKKEFGVKITRKDASILWTIHFKEKESSRQISKDIKLHHYYVSYRLSVLEGWGILKNDIFVELNSSIKTIFDSIKQ